MQRYAVYYPKPTYIPSDINIKRAVRTYTDNGIKNIPAEKMGIDLSRYDTKTIFYDTFFSNDLKYIFCVSPPFLNIGKPFSITHENKPLKFNIHVADVVTITRIKTNTLMRQNTGNNLYLEVKFPCFNISLSCAKKNLIPLTKTNITLVTMQKDNPIIWIKDWCLWYKRLHGISRIVIYDNASEKISTLTEKLKALSEEVEIILVHWPFPFGCKPVARHINEYSQVGAFNHFRLFFGDNTKWVLSLDIDEYLYINKNISLIEYLAKFKNRFCPIKYFKPCLVPDFTKIKKRKTPRFFHYAFVPGEIVGKVKKYCYQPRYIKINWVHQVLLINSIQKVKKLFCLKIQKNKNYKQIFFYHLKGINTGWRIHSKKLEDPKDKHFVFDSRLIRSAVKIGIKK